jgi:serralysin
VPQVSSVTKTGDAYIDGLLSGVKWATTSLTFSFPTDASFYGSSYTEPTNNFEAFTAQQQDAVRKILKMYSEVSNLAFTEVTESATVHGDLRYAESDSPSTAWAYYPSTSDKGGDSWFNNSKNYYDNPTKGNYAWLTMLHETGHALGLKHPHEAKGSFGVLPIDKDSLEYSVMSYKSYVGSTATSYTNGTYSYPQTLMMYDIAAIQVMYGANFTTNSGDTVYKWSATTGEMFINGVGQGAPGGNKIFMTTWDGGGNDTYDFSNYTTNLKVDLNPGGWTTVSTTQLAALGSGHYAAGNIANALLYQGNLASLIENAIGGAGHDVIIGNVGNNILTGGAGNDVLDGGLGVDTAWYSGLMAQYTWVENADGSWTVSDLRGGSPDGTDTLWNMEYLRFSDALVEIGSTVTPPTDDDPNLVPIAANDSYSTSKNTKLTIGNGGVLANDMDPDGDPLSALLVNGPQNGTVKLAADGSFVYTPKKNFVGTDSFVYRASDGMAESDLATVSISVTGATSSPGKGKTAKAADSNKDKMNLSDGGGKKNKVDSHDDHNVWEDQIPDMGPIPGDLIDVSGIQLYVHHDYILGW